MMEELIWKLPKRAGITIYSYLKAYHFNRSRAFLTSRILWQFNQYVSFREYQHKFHIVSPSPWPFLTGLSSFIFVIGMVSYMHNIFFSTFTLFLGFFCILLSMYFWFRDIVREGTFMGFHSFKVQSGLRLGFLLFIVSEIMFFFAFFWAYFHFSVCPSIWIGGVWPPEGVVYYPVMKWDLGNGFIYDRVSFVSDSYSIFFNFIFENYSERSSRYVLFNENMEFHHLLDPHFFLTVSDSGILVDPLTIPLLNTIILLSSGLVITFSHNSLRNKNYFNSILSLVITVFLGLLFFFFQIYEYTYSSFSINDGVYGTVFYMLTGFHGFHVLIGTIFLIVCLWRFILKHFTPNNHFGFEAAIWYWHFVDVVWIFLFFFIYLWPNFSFFYSGDDIYFDKEFTSFFIEGSVRALDNKDFSFFDYTKISFSEVQEVLKDYISILQKSRS